MKKKRKRKENRIFFIIFLFLIPLFSIFSDGTASSLENALKLEKQGKISQASLIFQEWLKGNSTHPEFYKVLLHFTEIEENPYTILSVLQKYKQLLKIENQQNQIAKKIAMIYEMLGDPEHAIFYYKSAFKDLSAWKNDISLLCPAKLLIAEGLYEQAKEWLYEISNFLNDDISYAEALFLTAKVNILLQNNEKALKILLHIKAKYQNKDIYPKCLLALIEFYFEQGKKIQALSILAELQKNYNQAPEYVLADLLLNGAKNKKIIIDFYPLPYRYLGAIQLGEETYTVTSAHHEEKTNPPPTAVQNEYSICVGSYQVYENASVRLQELADKKIKAEIFEKEIKGKRYFRVVVAKKYNYTQANEFMTKLKSIGFKESFLIKE